MLYKNRVDHFRRCKDRYFQNTLQIFLQEFCNFVEKSKEFDKIVSPTGKKYAKIGQIWAKSGENRAVLGTFRAVPTRPELVARPYLVEFQRVMKEVLYNKV